MARTKRKKLMDIFDKFFKKFSYKFPKGYPDINDAQDVLLLETFISEIIGESVILENQDLISLIKSNITDYGDLTPSGKTTLKLAFSDIPNTGNESKDLRNDVYRELKSLVDKEESLSNYRKEKGGSSLGSAIVNFDGKDYTLIIKGTPGEDSADTDVKEALVSLFYVTNIDTPFTKENYDERVNQLISIAEKGIPGESSDASNKVVTYLKSTNGDKSKYIKFINQPFSSALTIKEAYPGEKLIRDGKFTQAKSLGQQLSGYPSDKHNPGDLFVDLGGADLDNIKTLEGLNDLFVDSWGSKTNVRGEKAPFVSISLKQEAAQGGKAKALLQKYTKVKSDYNLSKEEQNYTSDEFRKGIKDLRSKVQSLVGSNSNIVYDFKDGNITDEKVQGKYAALKALEFLFRLFPDNKVDNAVVAIAGFALSLTGVNPTFFKLKGKSNGSPASVETFKRGESIDLFDDVDDNLDPIVIEDTSSFGGLKIKFLIKKGGEVHSVAINARNNGNTQGTIEIQDIKKVS